MGSRINAALGPIVLHRAEALSSLLGWEGFSFGEFGFFWSLSEKFYENTLVHDKFFIVVAESRIYFDFGGMEFCIIIDDFLILC